MKLCIPNCRKKFQKKNLFSIIDEFTRQGEKENLETLRNWVIQEAEFETGATEMKHGLKENSNRLYKKDKPLFTKLFYEKALFGSASHMGKIIQYEVVINLKRWMFMNDEQSQDNITYAIDALVLIILDKLVPEYKHGVKMAVWKCRTGCSMGNKQR